jgi:endogenous inhibitor of DNA gyrase (YacG/DUF329 family)
MPRTDRRQALEDTAIREAQTQLRKGDRPVPKDRPATIQAFLHAWQLAGKRQCPNCGLRFRARRNDAIYCSDTCRKVAYRDRAVGRQRIPGGYEQAPVWWSTAAPPSVKNGSPAALVPRVGGEDGMRP